MTIYYAKYSYKMSLINNEKPTLCKKIYRIDQYQVNG